MLESIPKSRLMLYIAILGLLPLVVVGLHFIGQNTEITGFEQRIESLRSKAITNQRKQSINQAVMDHYKNADHIYIDKYLETLTFLGPEVAHLKKLISNKNFAGDETVKRRLDKLTGPDNKLLFTFGQVVSYPNFTETTINLQKPVEVNLQDIQKILALTEGVEIGDAKPAPDRPQILVTDFKIEKKEENKNEVFLLNMKLLKREYL